MNMKRKKRQAKISIERGEPPVRLSRQVTRLIDYVQEERATVANAETTLRVLKVALINEDAEAANRPYYADVVELAADTLARAINALDTLSLHDVLTTRRTE